MRHYPVAQVGRLGDIQAVTIPRPTSSFADSADHSLIRIDKAASVLKHAEGEKITFLESAKTVAEVLLHPNLG